MSVTDETDVSIVANDPDADFFATSELPVPPPIPDVHFGTIESVGLTNIDNEDWPAQFVVKLRADDTPGLEAEYKIILPAAFYNDIRVDASTMGDSARTSYGIGVANSDGTGALQELKKLANGAGRNSQTVEGLVKPTTIEEYVNNFALLLTGLEVAFFRGTNKKAEGAFKNRLEVKGISSRENASNPKNFKKYVKAFEGAQG